MNPVIKNSFPARVRAAPLRYRPLLAALLSAGVMLPACAANGAAENAGAPRGGAVKPYALGAAPLADVLNRFAAESGVILVFDGDLLRGVQSQGLQGKFDVPAGFQALLAGTRFEAVMARSGGYILRQRAAPLPVREVTPAAAVPPRADAAMGEINVYASNLPTVERLDREMIANTASINGDLTSQLKLNPNIQYSESSLSSATGGEIAPAEISIHGAKPYQNEMLVDGVSIANDIDPGNKIVSTSPDFIPGAAQALAVDSSILCDIEVLDSNVSAEYGRFTGGVVNSKICSARKRFGGNVSIGYTSSDWSTLFIDPDRQAEFDRSASADLQPRFKKWTYKTTLEARPGDDWGVLMSVVRRKSEIPLRRFTTENAATTASREVTQQRVQDMLILKSDYSPVGGLHKGEVSLVYAPSSNTYFKEDFRDSDYTIRTGGLNLGGRLESRYASAILMHQLSFSQNEQSRRSDADYYRNWRWSTDKNWGDPAGSNPGSGEGAAGDVDQRTSAVSYRLRSAFTPFKAGETTQRVTAGVELGRRHTKYERLNEQYYYSTAASLPRGGALGNCQFADGSIDAEGCSATPTQVQAVGQYFRNLLVYHPGSFALNSNTMAAYVEDEAHWRDLSLRIGARADKDTLAGKANAAPRIKLGWQAAEPLYLDVGANRYYGRNLLSYALQEKINTLKTAQTRNVTSGSLNWGASAASKPLNRLEDLRSPYDDELTAGATYESDWLAGPLSVRFTRRDGKDQIVKTQPRQGGDCGTTQCYVYTNDGGSVTRDVTISWSNARAFKVAGVVTRMWVAANKSDVKSNYSSYADVYGADFLNDVLIRYDGKVIRNSERPADNYNRPWTLRIGAMSTMRARHLTINNVLRVRGGFEQMLRNGSVDYQGATIDNYEKTALPRSVAIDTVLHWTPRVYRDQNLDVKLTVKNITNHKNQVAVGDTYATYERGRTFALEIGYAF